MKVTEIYRKRLINALLATTPLKAHLRAINYMEFLILQFQPTECFYRHHQF